jgi:type IV secretion system protein TrbL
MAPVRIAAIAGLTLAACCLWAVESHAQVAALVNLPDQIIERIVGTTAGWIPTLQRYARNSFNTLALISIAFRLGVLALRLASAEEIVAELVSIILFLGFGVWIINDGTAFFKTVIDSFRQAGAVAGVGISPSDIVRSGLDISNDALSNVSRWEPGASLGLIVIALIVVACVAAIAGYMTIALLKSVIILPVIALASLFLGSRWTSDIAIRLLMQSIAVGLQLMTTQLLAGASLTMLRSMIGILKDFNGPNAGAVVAGSLLLAMCVKVIPDWVASAVGGSSIGESALVGRAATIAGTAAAGTVLAAAGVGVAGHQAAKLAQTQLAAAQAGGASASSGIGRVAQIAGSTATNMGKALAQDIGMRLSGQGSRHGSTPFRMAAAMGQETRLRNEDLNKPRP